MPLINGVCVPPICLRRVFLGGGATLMKTTTVGGVAAAPVNVGALFPAMLQKGLNDLAAAKDIDCDGCVCFTVKRWNPALRLAIPPYTVEQNTDTDAAGVVTVHTYQIVGAVYLYRSLGHCLPPGAKVKVGNAWVPVEELNKKTHGPSSGGGKGKKKKGKKNAGTTKRANRLGRLKRKITRRRRG